MAQGQQHEVKRNVAVVQQQETIGAPANIRRVNLRGRRNPKLNGKVDLSFSTCTKSISNVNISRRGLLALELSVGLAIFLDFDGANRGAKQMLTEVYSKAGYQCGDHTGKDYKTVRRRIEASAGLFGKFGVEEIAKWAEGKSENKLIQAFAQKVATLNFSNMEDVLDYLGRPNARTTKEKGVDPYNIEVGDGKMVKIPRSFGEAELLELAQKLMTLAEEVRGERRLESMEVAHERRKKLH